MAFQGLMRGLYGHGGVFISQDPIIIGGGGGVSTLQVLTQLPYLLKQLRVKVMILLMLT